MDRNTYLLPGAIILAGLILAGTIFFIRSGDTQTDPRTLVGNMRPVSPDEHIIGRPDAPVILVEYSDIDCSYCKQFQATMTQIMSDYGPDGQVAWVYRHFPSIQAHPFAVSHAEAAECVAELGNENLFWRFIDALQQQAPGSEQFKPGGYEEVVQSLGVSVPAFTECMASNRYAEKINADFENALAAGGTGTPYMVLLIRGHDAVPISGAVPYASMKKIIEQALEKAATN